MSAAEDGIPRSGAVQGTQDKGLPHRTMTLPPGKLPEFLANPSIDSQHIWLGGPSGSTYLTNASRKRIKSHCVRRDGEKCMFCHILDNYETLVIHHVDGIIANNYSDNLQLLHWDCNVDTRWGLPSRRLTTVVPTNHPPTPKKTDTELSTHRTELLEDKTTTSAQRTNLENELEFRRACFQATLDMEDPAVTDKDKFMGRRGMMGFAMEWSGSSQDAAYGYIRRLFAPRTGPLIEEPDIYSKLKLVKFRDPKDYKLTVEQILAKYPKEGLAYSS